MSTWETGDPFDIFRRYGNTQRGAPFPTFGGAPIMPRQQFQPAAGLLGPVGPPGFPSAGMPRLDTGWTGIGGGVPRPPSESSMQRAQTEAEQQNAAAATNQQADQDMRGLSPQRRYFWATGRVDARPTQNPNNTAGRMMPTNWDDFFGPSAKHMGSPGTTWAERQAYNQNRISGARAQRGLSPY